MHYLILYVLVLALVATPTILIFFSARLSGWAKVKWVVRAALAPFLPGLLYVAGLVIAVKLGGYGRTSNAVMFGSYVPAAANLVSIALPWVVLYFARRAAQAEKGHATVTERG
ncbi:MAG: hypothetical protein MUE59_03395 [Thiobacillaceae bacterium]|jgi:hypothetical protein|nr:hypothetical protein [Thiobacillaceae bacterium]